MSAIPASSVSLKTMMDGTLRISFDVEPANAREAFQLFATPGTQAALAALRDGSFLEQSATVDDVPEKQAVGQYKHLIHNEKAVSTSPKIGDACMLAVQWCKDPQFWAWIDSTTHGGVLWPCKNAQSAKDFICEMCDVDSRKDLDVNCSALDIWNEFIRKPFRDYLMQRGKT